MNPRNFFAELKRRNVYRVAVAWLLLQAASIFLPAFDAPPWVMKTFIIVIIFGFPVALIFSWAFEITPEGIKLESEIEPNKSIKRRTGRKLVAVTIALAVVAAGLLAFNLFRTKPVTPLITATPNTNKSVAVLAFANLSDDKGSEYFSDGISEELLTVLQKIPGMHVAARTSAFSFKRKNATAQEIGQKLGVTHLVEGSVRPLKNRRHHLSRCIAAWRLFVLLEVANRDAVEGEIGKRANVAKSVAEFLSLTRPVDWASDSKSDARNFCAPSDR